MSRPVTWSVVNAPPARQTAVPQQGFVREQTITNLTVVNLSCRAISEMSHTHWTVLSTHTDRLSSLEFCVSRSGNDIFLGANGGAGVAQTIFVGYPGDTVVISGITTTVDTQTLHVSDNKFVLNAATGSFGQLNGAGMIVSLSQYSPQITTNASGQWILQNGLSTGVSVNVQSIHTTSIQHWNAILSASPAIGDMKMNVLSTENNGWLLCDGRSLDRTAYASLFAVVGTTFGAPSGSTFQLPNATGRVLGNTSGTFPTGTYTGLSQVQLSAANVPSHTHAGTTGSSGSHAHSVTDPGHTHTQWTINDDYNSSGSNPPGFAADSAGYKTWSNINSSTTGVTVDSAGAHTHAFTTDGGAGLSGTAFGIMQPTVFVGYTFIFAG